VRCAFGWIAPSRPARSISCKTAAACAGGESRQMGRDKATLILDDEPFWFRQLRTLRESQPDRILVSARTRPAWCPADSNHTFAALAVDLPQMTSTHLVKLWSMADLGVGVVPRNGVRFEPLCAIYSSSAVKAVEAVLARGDASM